ncbi:MAG: hypothetical protein FJ255_01925 [Phycisphaerae bacterium]|nr:hypothetical protein [Phycisphaerae bacterium]
MRTIPMTVALALFIGFTGCEKSPSPPAPSKPAAPTPPAPSPAASADGAVDVLGVTFRIPEGWTQVAPANSMRLAELVVPDAAGQPECSVVFSTAGGTVDSNLERWAGQVQPEAGGAKTEVQRSEVAGLRVSVGEWTGAFAGMGEAPARSGWTLRGAIVETPQGLLFVKMTGPREPMAAATESFNAMIAGLAAK